MAANNDIITLAELNVTLFIDNNEYKGTLYVRYPTLDPRNKITRPQMYSYVEFSTRINGTKPNYPIINGNAKFEHISDDTYTFIHSGGSVKIRYIFDTQKYWYIARFRHAIGAKPIPNCFASKIWLLFMYRIIYKKTFRTSKNQAHYRLNGGTHVLSPRPIHQMIVLALQASNQPRIRSIGKTFKKWWEENKMDKLDGLTYPRPGSRDLHKWLKNPDQIYRY